MNKWMAFGVPVVLIMACVLVMVSGVWLKRPLSGEDDVLGLVQELEQLAIEKDWEKALGKAAAAQEAWQRVVNRVQFSVEREMIYEISGSLAKMQGAARAEDASAMLQEVYYFYDLWSHLAS